MAEVTAPLAGSSPAMGGVAIQMAVALLLILFVILLAFWALRRFGPKFGLGGGSARSHGLKVEGHLTLGPRKNIMVVRFLNKLLLLGVTDQSITLLTEVDAHDGHADFKTALEDAGSSLASGPAAPPGPGPGG